MKKYKPYKLITIMFLLSIVGDIGTYFIYKSGDFFKFALLAVCCGLISIFSIVVLFYFIRIYDDKIVFRQGFFMTKNGKNPFKVKESWISNFVMNTIYFDQIDKVVFGQNNQMLIIKKDGSRISISFGGYSKEIQSLIVSKLSTKE